MIGDCWVDFPERINDYGYTFRSVKIDGKVRAIYGHKLAYEVLLGPIPKYPQIDHLCRNRACYNSNHLGVVTQQENISRGKRSCKKCNHLRVKKWRENHG